MALQYSEGIVITDQRRSGNNMEAIAGVKGQEFINSTKDCLDELKRLATGARLLSEIDASGHVVKIYRTWEITGGNSQGGSTNDEMVKALGTKYTDGTTELQDVLNAATEDLSGRSKVKKFFGIGKPKPKFIKREAIARLVGVTDSDLVKMSKGKKEIPPTVDARLRSYLYDFLTPGKGCDCYVLFNHVRDNLSPEHKQYLPMSHLWQHRPPGIALGHELIHAWRSMTGMVLFEYGWEEEAMTVGLPPFGFMQLTENRLRIESGGLAVRADYQNLMPKTPLTAGMKLGVDGDMAWQGKQGALHPGQAVAQKMSARRKAMGYGTDDAEGGADSWGDDDGF